MTCPRRSDGHDSFAMRAWTCRRPWGRRRPRCFPQRAIRAAHAAAALARCPPRVPPQDSSVEELLSGLASGHQATHMAGAYDSLRQAPPRTARNPPGSRCGARGRLACAPHGVSRSASALPLAVRSHAAVQRPGRPAARAPGRCGAVAMRGTWELECWAISPP